jgi:hypothetical protein
MPMMTAAHNPTRSERRTRRGLRAPNACAASGATAETGPHADDESDEEDQVRETDGGNSLLAEAADQCEIGRHHGDLAKLRQRDRPCEPDRFDHVGTPRRAPGRRRRSGSDDGPGQCHGAAP